MSRSIQSGMGTGGSLGGEKPLTTYQHQLFVSSLNLNNKINKDLSFEYICKNRGCKIHSKMINLCLYDIYMYMTFVLSRVLFQKTSFILFSYVAIYLQYISQLSTYLIHVYLHFFFIYFPLQPYTCVVLLAFYLFNKFLLINIYSHYFFMRKNIF